MSNPNPLPTAAYELATLLEHTTGNAISPCQHSVLLVAALPLVERVLGNPPSLWTAALLETTGNIAVVTRRLGRLLPGEYFQGGMLWGFSDAPDAGEAVGAVSLFLGERLGGNGLGLGPGRGFEGRVRAKI
jgi:hypothetical protein